MNVSVGKQAEEMHFAIVFLGESNCVLPCGGFIDLSAFDGLVDKLRTLGINLSAAQRIMSDFGVSHIRIGRQTDCCSVRLDCGMRPLCHQFFNLRFVSVENGVAHVLFGPSDTVHNNQYYRFCHCV